jgi:DNA-binding MarR family transcriptional regulator
MVVRKGGKAASRSPERSAPDPDVPDLTVGVAALLEAGGDAAFRDFVADLFAAASGMLAVRRALGKATGLTGAEIAMLLAIRRLSGAGSISVKALAEHLHVAGPHVTAETAKLAEAGLVEKRVDKTDNRAVDIRLTVEGERALRKLTPLVRAANDVLFAGMTQAEMEHVHRFLRRIVTTSAAAVDAVE